jgi:hypothetical protein
MARLATLALQSAVTRWIEDPEPDAAGPDAAEPDAAGMPLVAFVHESLDRLRAIITGAPA